MNALNIYGLIGYRDSFFFSIVASQGENEYTSPSARFLAIITDAVATFLANLSEAFLAESEPHSQQDVPAYPKRASSQCA